MSIKFDYIFHASGTGVTQAGLVVGQALDKNEERKIVGISIARSIERGKQEIVNAITEYFSEKSMKIIGVEDLINFEDAYTVGGYGKYNDEILSMMLELLKTDSLPLDVTYTGKAFLGMMKYIDKKEIRNRNILFIHTGGTPLFYNDLGKLI